MNLYLYILPHFAHPVGVSTRLVSGKILCVHLLCSDNEYINRCMKEFFVRLLDCRYQHDFLIPAFRKGIMGACAYNKRGSVRLFTSYQDKDTKVRVFFHLTCHPRDPISKYIQHQWRQHLLHLPWEPPLWRLKNKYKFPLVSNQCVWHIADPKISVIYSRTEKSIVSTGPLSPPICSRDWGPVVF